MTFERIEAGTDRPEQRDHVAVLGNGVHLAPDLVEQVGLPNRKHRDQEADDDEEPTAHTFSFL